MKRTNAQEGPLDRRRRRRREVQFEIEALPLDMQRTIAGHSGIRPVLRYAQTSRQSEEIVAQAFAAVFKRDLLLFTDPMVDLPPFEVSWADYKFKLATLYELVIDDVAAGMAAAVADLARDLYRYRALYHKSHEFEVTCSLADKRVATILFHRMQEETNGNVSISPGNNSNDPDLLSAIRRFEQSLAGAPNAAVFLSSSAGQRSLQKFFANLLLGVSPWLTVQLDRISNVWNSAGGGHVSMATHGFLVKDQESGSDPNDSESAADEDDFDFEAMDLSACFARLSL
jgi:hypothetical protein